MWELIQSNILEIIITIMTGLATYVATRIKSKYEEYVNTETKQKIVKTVVNAVEQLYKDLDGTKKLEKAKENIKLAEFEKNITILEGDAEEILKEVEGPFDMIFMDAAKGQYKLFYDMIIDKLRVDGLLISDNILYKGMVAHDDFVIRRKKTIVKRMRNYLDYICNCDYLSTSLIPIGDGVALSYKNNKRGDINA